MCLFHCNKLIRQQPWSLLGGFGGGWGRQREAWRWEEGRRVYIFGEILMLNREEITDGVWLLLDYCQQLIGGYSRKKQTWHPWEPHSQTSMPFKGSGLCPVSLLLMMYTFTHTYIIPALEISPYQNLNYWTHTLTRTFPSQKRPSFHEMVLKK